MCDDNGVGDDDNEDDDNGDNNDNDDDGNATLDDAGRFVIKTDSSLLESGTMNLYARNVHIYINE